MTSNDIDTKCDCFELDLFRNVSIFVTVAATEAVSSVLYLGEFGKQKTDWFNENAHYYYRLLLFGHDVFLL